MVISISIMTVIGLVLVLNSIVEHIFNWVFRLAVKEDTAEGIMFLVVSLLYILKWVGVLLLITNILKEQ